VTTPPVQDAQRRTGSSTASTRGHFRVLWDLVFNVVRFLARHVDNARTVFGIFLLSGAVVAVAFTWAFAKLAEHVRGGGTQAFDDAVMRWIALHQNPKIQAVMLEVTALGTGTVVGMLVLVAGMFLWLNSHKHSALLLIAATVGGILLNNLLKIGFSRPRPQIFEWGTHAASSSFPSGHAMSSIVVYGTVAYLAARLQQRAATRVLTMLLAGVIIVAICGSRVYLGVHFPSDILAGLMIGLAWAGFCMAVLEAAQLYAKRNAPEMLAEERPAPRGASPST
jgi:undecaprenyl-diphosphatase